MPGVYRPRHPEKTVLYRVLFHHFDQSLAEYESRFEKEYGFQGMPEMNSLKRFAWPEDLDLSSEVMKTHQKHRIGYPVIDNYLKWYYRWPRDFEAYSYVSQVLQAFGIGLAIEAHRRAMPFCMGTF